MKKKKQEEGFILVLCLLVIVVLSIIGVTSVRNTTMELQIAGNDRVHKKTFYEAEGGAMLGIELLEQSFACLTGFNETNATLKLADLTGTPIRTYERDGDYVLWNNAYPTCSDLRDNNLADGAYPIVHLDPNNDGNPSDNLQETGYLYFGGETTLLAGGALQMAAGYEGKGKSAGQGGVAKLNHIYSKFQGLRNSETVILMGWRHLVGNEDFCNYD